MTALEFILQGFGDGIGDHRLVLTPNESTCEGDDFLVFGAEAKIEFLVGVAGLSSLVSTVLVLVGLQFRGPRNSFIAFNFILKVKIYFDEIFPY